MAERDGSAVNIDLVSVPAHLLVYCASLGGEGFVGFDQIEIVYGPARFFQGRAAGWDRTRAHDRGVNPGGSP